MVAEPAVPHLPVHGREAVAKALAGGPQRVLGVDPELAGQADDRQQQVADLGEGLLLPDGGSPWQTKSYAECQDDMVKFAKKRGIGTIVNDDTPSLTPQLVLDINTTPLASNPSGFVAVGSSMLGQASMLGSVQARPYERVWRIIDGLTACELAQLGRDARERARTRSSRGG